MKTVLSNPYHLWAHEAQSCARNATRTKRFEGPLAYSYVTVIGAIVRNAEGAKAYIISAETYSVTTARHIRDLQAAVHGLGHPVFTVILGRYGDLSHDLNVGNYMQQITDNVGKAKRARKHSEVYLRAATTFHEELQSYCLFFGLTCLVTDIDTVGDALKARASAQRAEDARRAEARAAKLLADVERDLPRWMAGENVRLPYGLPYAFMRLNGDIVETSQGAEVPVDHVRRAAPIILRALKNGTAFKADGETVRLGYFTLKEVTSDGVVVVGCHRFERTEIERFSAILG
jgi:GTP:adenosylcobinamide-phosphate guanylyltransferase